MVLGYPPPKTLIWASEAVGMAHGKQEPANVSGCMYVPSIAWALAYMGVIPLFTAISYKHRVLDEPTQTDYNDR